MNTGLGSAFLGDRTHHMSIRGHPSFVTSPPTSPPPRPTTIDPITSLNLRIKWLDALVLGLKGAPESKTAEASSSRDLFHRAEEIQAKLNDALETNESCRKFIKNCNE